MDKKEYIKYLADQGFSKEDILIKLRDFDRGIIDMPKKITDPVKTETSTGSIDDMVSNLGDFSSESPTNNLYGFRVNQEAQTNGMSKEDYELLSNTVKKASNKFDESIETQEKLPNEDLNIEEKSSPESYEDISKARQNMDYATRKQSKFGEGKSIAYELLKKEESNLAENIVNRTGRSVMHGGSLSERSNFLNTVNAIDNAKYYAPEAEKINEMWSEVSNEAFGMSGTERTVGDVFSGIFGTPGKNLASRENVFDITNINSSKYNTNKPTSASQIAFSYDGAMPESFTGMVFDMETLRDIHLDKISEQQYSEDIKNSGNKKQFTSKVLDDGLFLLNSYQKKYKKIKDEYESPSTTKERKAELKKELEDFEFGEDLYGAEGTIDKFKSKPTSKTEKQNKFANLYNWDDIKEEDNKEAHNESIYNRADAIASSSTKEELENMVAKSYSRLRAISKDFVAYIEDLEKMPNAERKWLESKKDEWGGNLGLTAFAEQMNLLEKVVASIDDDSTGTSAVPQKAVASLKQSFNSIKQMSESGRLPKDFTKLPGDHPYSKAWNSAIDEFIALNRAVQINVNPLTTEKDGFWAGAFQNVANRAESLGFTSELTDDKAAKAFVEAITNGDTSYLDPKETKERLTSTTANTIGDGTMDLAFIAGEMAVTRKLIPGIKLIKKIPSVVSGLNVVKNSNNAKKAINFATNLTANVIDESVVFGSSTALFGGTQKEIKESAKFGASMGVGNTVAGKVGQAVFSRYFKSSPFARKMYNYYTVQRASQAVQGAATGSIVFNGVNIMSEGAPLDKDGKVDAEKILESTLIEFSKMIVLGGFTGAPKKFKDLTYEIKQDLYTLRGRDAASEAAAKSFGLDHKRIDNNEDGLLDEIQEINNQKTKEVTDRLESGSISEDQAVEQIKEIENNSRTLRNRYEINQYKLRYESEKKNKLVASEDELARIGNKVLYGEKLNAKESEIFSNTPLSVVLNSVGAKGKKVLNDPSQVKYIELQKNKENIINNYLQYTLEYKTQKESQERELAYNHLSKMVDTSYELQYLKGKENNSKSEKQRIKELEEQLESLENGESFRELQEIIRLGNIERYNEDVNTQREILRSTKEGELIEIETEKEFSEKYEETYNKALDTENFNTFGFYDKDAKKFYVNKERALLERRVTTGKHEGFHFVLRDSLKDENGNVTEEGKKIIDDVLNQLSPEQRELVARRVNQSYARDERGRFVKKAEYYEENLTVLSELIASNEIQFRKEIGKALNPLTFLFRKKGFENLELGVDTGRELFNLVESYSKNEAIGLEKAKEISKAARGSKMSGLAESREKKTVLEEINNLLPESIETKEQFLSDRSFTKVYESAMNPGGAINNYIKSRTSSAMETELAVDSVLERLMNFDPKAKRKDGSTIGREGFGEFIFANTAFGKLDAKKKLFQESERKSRETSIDESTKQIADVETVEETQTEVKEKPTINPLKFTGVPSEVKLSDEPGKGLTFKKVAKQYAGEVGQQAIGIPAKKITESAANLGSVNEARAIQQFFFKADNLDKFIKILPEYNIAIPETKIGLETLDVPKDVSGTGLGLPKRILDYFYEDFIDPTGKLTSPKGRSKGLTSQTAVKRLKPEFRGTVSKETIDKIKKDIGITPKGELNVLPKGELRSPIGQLLKGMAKTYSTLAANTLVRQKMIEASASKEELARVAGGKRDAMFARERKITIEELKKATKEKSKITSFNPTTVVATRSEHQEILTGEPKPIPDNKERRLIDRFALLGEELEKESGETFIDGVYRISNKFLNIKENSKFRDVFKKALTYGLDRSIIGLSAAFEMNIPRPKGYDKKTQNTTSDNSYTEKRKYSKKFHEKTKDENFHKEQDARMEEYFDLFRAASDFVEKYPEEKSEWFWEQFFKAATNSQSHISRANFPIKTRQIDPKTKKPIFDKEGVEEHQQPQSEAVAILKNSLGNKEAMERAIKIVRKIASQGFITKENNDKLDIQYKENSPELLIDQFDRIANGEFDELPDGFLSTFRSAEADINLNELEWMPIGKTTDVVTVAEILFGTDKLPLQLADGRFIQKELYRDYLKGDKTLKQLREYGKQFEKTTEQEAKLLEVNSKLYNKAIPSRERKNSSKSILNDLSNVDKALRNSRNSKAPLKGISVFDFDDTLATSKSMVGVTMPDGTETKIDATEFAKRGEELLKQGAEFDFSDFSKVVDGKPGPLIAKLDKAIKKFGNKDVFVLTARPANSASAIHEFLKGIGYEIPLENITGLANSAPEAKAQWMVDKAAKGYNDFYFTDDAYKNVKAVQDAMKVLDVKSKERIVYKDIYDKMDKEFNDILEAKSGVASEKVYSKAKAEVVGSSQGKFKWFIPPSADDFVGLLYSTLAKGKLGDNQMAWYKKNLLDPYARAMNNISSERVSLAADYKALKKQLGIVPKDLRKKIEGEGFTKEQAVRMYIWNKQGMDIPGLSKSDLADMVKYVESDANLQVFADQLIEINKGDGYPAPKDYWLAGSVTTDLMDGLGGTKRAKHLEEWQQNVDAIFSEKNLNKLQAIHGKPYREALENMLQRMKSGKNRNYAGDSTTGRMMDWLNGSIGAIMFLNTRSAVLQTLSAVNFINFKDNNILAAGKAFANQPQYWKDFKELFNSDFLKERRDNATITINESDIADMANKGGAKGAISYLLQKGFTPTQIADSFAIASGGATFYRNRIKSYIKQGMSETEAKEKAFLDFRETAEESQQSSRPDRISKQQSGPLGRVVLAFANTPSQYARIIKKASQDLMAGRGDAKTNISKIIYYGAVQGFIFNAIQQALFAADLDDEDEKTEKMVRLGNGMADGVLRGMGVSGAAVAVVKNAGLRVYNESQKDRPKYEKVAFELTKLSPPIASKLSRINQAAREVQWNSDEMKQKGFSLDNPAWLAAGNVISATTNVPLDRVIKKVNNISDALSQDLEMQERIALLAGWQSWELGIEEEKDKKEKISNSSRGFNRKSKDPYRRKINVVDR